MILKELMIGSFVGIVSRLLITILDITGTLISSQIGLSSATVMNPNMQGSTITSSQLTLFGIAVFLSLDLHHLIFAGLVQSYQLFPLGGVLQIGDMAQGFIQLFSRIFWFGVQLSLPIMIVFFVMQMAFGLLNRIIPQMQIFFISLPFQLWAGLFIFLISCGTILGHFGKMFENEFAQMLKMLKPF
jgi:flagellar biosynthetic protein FliR